MKRNFIRGYWFIDWTKYLCREFFKDANVILRMDKKTKYSFFIFIACTILAMFKLSFVILPVALSILTSFFYAINLKKANNTKTSKILLLLLFNFTLGLLLFSISNLTLDKTSEGFGSLILVIILFGGLIILGISFVIQIFIIVLSSQGNEEQQKTSKSITILLLVILILNFYNPIITNLCLPAKSPTACSFILGFDNLPRQNVFSDLKKDFVFWTLARDLRDVSLCLDIDGENKERCEETVNFAITNDQIMKGKDISYCIAQEGKNRTQCITNLAIYKNDKSICSNINRDEQINCVLYVSQQNSRI